MSGRHGNAKALGCGEECPYVPGVTYVDWPVADSGGPDEATVRKIVLDLDGPIRSLLIELVPDIELPLEPRATLSGSRGRKLADDLERTQAGVASGSPRIVMAA